MVSSSSFAISGRVLGVDCAGDGSSLSLVDGEFLNENRLNDLYPSIADPLHMAFLLVEQVLTDSPNSKESLSDTYIKIERALEQAKIYPGFSSIEAEDLLIERSPICEEFVVAELRKEKILLSPRFEELGSLSKSLILAELLLLDQVQQYSPVHLRSLVYSLFSQDFFSLAERDQHRKLFSAGFDQFEYGNYWIDLTKERFYREDDGSLSSVRLVQASLLKTSYGDCFASNQTASLLNNKFSARKLFISSCELTYSGTIFPIRKNSFIRFEGDEKLSSFYVEAGSTIQYRKLLLKAPLNGSPAMVFPSYSKDNLVGTFRGFFAEMDLLGQKVKLRDFENIIFSSDMPWPSHFYTDELLLLHSPIGNLLVSKIIVLGEGAQFMGGVILEQQELRIQSKKVYAQRDTFLSFSEKARLLKLTLAKTESFQTSLGRILYFMAGQTLVFNDDALVVNF